MSPERLPTVSFCTLSPEALRERLAVIRDEVLSHATSSEVLPDGRAWSFRAGEARRAQLEELVALERECCGDGVAFELSASESGLRLAVRGVDPWADVFRALEPETRRRRPPG